MIPRGLIVVVAVLLGGCGVPTTPTAIPTVESTPTATLPLRLDPAAEALSEAIRFRTSFGLRADEAWIRSVALDPTNDQGQTFGVPLLPAEANRVLAQQAAANSITDLIARYGATQPDDWAGLYVDQPNGGRVVVRFAANMADHQRALTAILPAGANFVVEEASWSNDTLRGFMAEIEQERDWFPTIGATLIAANFGALDNFGAVDVRFEGPDPEVATQIEAHFGNPPWLRAVWDGPGAWTGPRGEIEIFTVDVAGRRVGHIDIVLDALDDRVESGGDMGIGTNKRGRLLLENLPAVTYRVSAFVGVAGERRLVGEGIVTLLADHRVSVRLTVR